MKKAGESRLFFVSHQAPNLHFSIDHAAVSLRFAQGICDHQVFPRIELPNYLFSGNIFRILNMKKANPYKQLGVLFRQISHPTRLKILREIGRGEACVCHLEAMLGMRQAYLSQHLMALRDAQVLITERDGRYIYYRLADPAILELVDAAGEILGIELSDELDNSGSQKACNCPKCSREH